MRRRVRIVAAIVLSVVMLSGPALAISGGVDVTGTVTIDSPDGPEVAVTAPDGGELLLDGPDGPNTVEVVFDDGMAVQNATFTSPDPTSVDVQSSEIEGTYSRVTAIDTGSTELTVDPEDKESITVSGAIESVEWQDAIADDSGRDFSYSASGTASVSISTDTATESLLAVDQSTGTVLDQSTTDSNGRATFDSLDSGTHDVEIVQPSTPTLDDDSATPKSGTIITETPAQLDINVSDADFGSSLADSVTVEFYDASDDSLIGNDTLTSNGTASVEATNLTGGENTWYAVATDQFGNSETSSTFTFNSPDGLLIYQETEPTKLITTDVPIRIRFFVDGEDTVVEKTTTNGGVSLEGLPTNKRFIVTVRANNTEKYTYRRVIVDSLIEGKEVYLLDKSKPNDKIIFQLDDPTGEFPPQETTLYVEKPITKDFDEDGENETQYKTIAGDIFGAAGEFPVVLQQGARYRLRVETDEASRILGSYSPAGDAVVPLQIKRIKPIGDTDSGSSVYGGIEGSDGNPQLAVRYLDPNDQTDSVTYRVKYQNGTTWIPNTTREVGQFADVYPLEGVTSADSASYTVEYWVDRGGQVQSGEFAAGQIAEIAQRLGIPTYILSAISYGLILTTIGLVVLVRSSLAPFAGTSVATMLTILGTVAIPGPLLGMSGAISVLVLIGRR